MRIKMKENFNDSVSRERVSTSLTVDFCHDGNYFEEEIEDAITNALECASANGDIITEDYTNIESLGSPSDYGIESEYMYMSQAIRDFHSNGTYDARAIDRCLDEEFARLPDVEYLGCNFESVDYYENERTYDYSDEI